MSRLSPKNRFCVETGLPNGPNPLGSVGVMQCICCPSHGSFFHDTQTDFLLYFNLSKTPFLTCVLRESFFFFGSLTPWSPKMKITQPFPSSKRLDCRPSIDMCCFSRRQFTLPFAKGHFALPRITQLPSAACGARARCRRRWKFAAADVHKIALPA